MSYVRPRVSQDIMEELLRRTGRRTLNEALRALLGGRDADRILSGDWVALQNRLFSSPSLQVVGNVGSGKTYTVQELIRNDSDHVYIVFDAHDEYDFLLRVDSITDGFSESVRVVLPPQPAAAKGVFPLYVNQILTRKWPERYVFVIEEALRYPEVVGLLAESRKFARILTVSQRRIVEFVPAVFVRRQAPISGRY